VDFEEGRELCGFGGFSASGPVFFLGIFTKSYGFLSFPIISSILYFSFTLFFTKHRHYTQPGLASVLTRESRTPQIKPSTRRGSASSSSYHPKTPAARIMPVTTPSPAASPAGQQRRISSFKTTLNFFKSSTKGIASQRRDFLTGIRPSAVQNNHINPIPLIALIAEEESDNISHTELRRPPTRVDTDPVFDSQLHTSSRYHSTSSFDRIGRSTGNSTTHISNGAAEIEVMSNAVRGGTPGSRGGAVADAEQRPGSNHDKQSAAATTSGGGGKKTAAKLRMALNLLRRRSNPNLRKAYVEPVDEVGENWAPFNNVGCQILFSSSL
jgi:hypothetical protein